MGKLLRAALETVGVLLIWLFLSAAVVTAFFLHSAWRTVSASDHPHQVIGYGLLAALVSMIAVAPVYLPVSLIVIGYFSYRRIRRRALGQDEKPQRNAER